MGQKNGLTKLVFQVTMLEMDEDKAISLGKGANGAISGLNKMIGGINKISKAITSKKLNG